MQRKSYMFTVDCNLEIKLNNKPKKSETLHKQRQRMNAKRAFKQNEQQQQENTYAWIYFKQNKRCDEIVLTKTKNKIPLNNEPTDNFNGKEKSVQCNFSGISARIAKSSNAKKNSGENILFSIEEGLGRIF